MANQNIRVPKQGKTAHSRSVASAVDNQAWQEFRLSLKGETTKKKLSMLKSYLANGPDDVEVRGKRVKNYLGALARGGQIVINGEFRSDFSHVTVKKEK